METRSTTMTVADYCNAVDRGEIVVNRNYQRSDKIWPADARSFLIETILLGFPLPKISLNSRTDLKTRNPYKEIVDGQQRTVAINDFFRGDLALSQSIDTDSFKGRTYAELEEEAQQRFIDYPLSVDLFVGATDKDVRETFRRMNSYTIPLNPEEQRHAVFQGRFKWSLYRLARNYEDIFAAFGTFTEKAFIRMADIKLLTEIVHAYYYGVTTTNNKNLNALYRRFDKTFPDKALIEKQIGDVIEEIAEIEVLRGGPLKKPYMIYSVILAIWHRLFDIESLRNDFGRPRRGKINWKKAEIALSELAAALEGDDPGEFEEFVTASTSRTNVKSQREIRIRTILEAMGRSNGRLVVEVAPGKTTTRRKTPRSLH